jgi:uncharacterized protein YndB with AHSA1/START domain
MATQERSRDTTASPDAVWRIWSDPSTWPTWNPDVRSISLDGPFESGVSGSMTTGQRTHSIRIENVAAGRSFDLVTSVLPATTFRFHCEIRPSESGSRISQAISMGSFLGPVFSPMMSKKIAESFGPILDGLAREAESA